MSTTQSTSGITLYDYDLDGRPTNLTLPSGGVLHADYDTDTAGRLDTLTLPGLEGVLDFGYHATTGALSTLSGPLTGTSLAFTYDGPLMTSMTWSDAVWGSHSVHRDYDANLRLGCECLGSACTDSAGGCTGGTYPVAYTYDNDGLLTAVGALALERDTANGLLLGTTLGVVSEEIIPNGFAEPTSIVTRRGDPITGDILLFFDYAASSVDSRDKLGRIKQKVETVLGESGRESRTVEYDYLAFSGRLQDVAEDGLAIRHYEYDDNGNRLSVANLIAPPSTVTGTYDAQDRLITYGTANYEYSANGTLRKKTTPAGITTYDYDSLGNLRGVTLPNADVITYTLDGAGRRIGKSVNSAPVQGFIYRNGLQIVAELGPSGDVVARFVYGSRPNVPDYKITSSGTFRLLSDHLGSIRAIVDTTTGAIVARMDYDEFGRLRPGSDVGMVPFGFAGGLYDEQTGLVRFGARDYDAETGRWTGKDPSLFAGGFNLYGYANGDPVNYIDVDGHNPALAALAGACLVSGVCEAAATAAVAAAATGAAVIVGSAIGELGKEWWQSWVKKPESPTCPAPTIDDFDDPTKPPGPGFEWKGKGPPKDGKGSWVDKLTGDKLHPDLDHPLPIGPHWDWIDKGSGWDDGWRISPDGTVTPK